MNFYDENANHYFNATFEIEMSEVYKPFLNIMKEGAKILDAGCGSGRDTLAFKKLGFQVDAFDSSKNMVDLARENTGIEVKHQSFLDTINPEYYDGIWCCASLVHVPPEDLLCTIEHLAQSLCSSGYMYISFKHGHSPTTIDGRSFTNMTVPSVRALLSRSSLLTEESIWLTESQLKPNESWLNLLVRKSI